jgi:aryl-alcohol dehydrogenase-like predicted oxidoreductase
MDAVEVNLNLIDQRAIECGLLHIAKIKNVGVIARTTLAFGYLTGTLTGEEELSMGDHRAKWPKEQLKTWANAHKLFTPLCKGYTPTQLAIRWCLDQGVSTVIPGAMSLDQIEELTHVSDIMPLTTGMHQEIRKIYENNNFFEVNRVR